MRRSASTLAVGGLASKAIGVLRELLMARTFGTGTAVDAFRAAQTTSLVAVHVLLSDALNAGFIPLYKRHLAASVESARALFVTLNFALMLATVAIALALAAAAPEVIAAVVPGFASTTRDLTIDLLRITALGLPFYAQGSLLAYLELAHDRYLLASTRAAFLNVGVIAGIVIAMLDGDPRALAWGFTGSQIVYAGVALLRTRIAGLLRTPAAWDAPLARALFVELVRVVRPLFFLSLFLQGNLLLERFVASLIGPGTVAALEYARIVTETGQALIAVPLGLASLAELSGLERRVATERLASLLPPLLVLLVPASVALAVHGDLVVELLYARGAFGADSVALTSIILRGFGVGFWAQVIGVVLVRGLNAQLRNRDVVLCMGSAYGLQAIINLTLYPLLGATTLGVSAAVAAVVLVVLTATRLGLAGRFWHGAWPLLGGALGYWLLAATALPPAAGRPRIAVIGATGLAFGLYWLVWITAWPRLRSAVRTLLPQRGADR